MYKRYNLNIRFVFMEDRTHEYLPQSLKYWFQRVCKIRIYVDKSELIAFTNKKLGTEQKNICVSRPRRFGKSMAAKMLAAYYSKGCDSASLFENCKISNDPSYPIHLNRYNVIFLNMQNFLSLTHNAGRMLEELQAALARELVDSYKLPVSNSLPDLFNNIFSTTGEQFIFIIDEWDCIFREKQESEEGHLLYLDFLRNLLKDRSYVLLCYMTGPFSAYLYCFYLSFDLYRVPWMHRLCLRQYHKLCPPEASGGR